MALRSVDFHQHLTWRWNFMGLTFQHLLTALACGMLARLLFHSVFLSLAATVAAAAFIVVVQTGQAPGYLEDMAASLADPKSLVPDDQDAFPPFCVAGEGEQQ